MGIVMIKEKASTPKYKQIIASVEDAIINGDLKKGDRLPSLNSIKNQHSLSRDTVLSAFNELKTRGIIQSIVGKGYYVASENVTINQRIFLLFDELNYFKEDLYNSFLANLGANIQVDIYFHHFNSNIFKKLIADNIGGYNYYVIMPANLKNTGLVIEQLPRDSVYILDQLHEDLEAFPAVYQNFEKAIFNNLTKALPSIKKYNKLILIFSKNKQPVSMLKGFNSFCDKNKISSQVVEDLKGQVLKKGELYIAIEDRNLLQIIKKIKSQKLVLAKDIGVISYNDTLLKEIVEGGITTISTDFEAMGKHLAQMILNKDQRQIENPNHLIVRNSF